MNRDIYSIIFDLNGTLVNSEMAHWLGYRDVLLKYDIAFTFEEFIEDWVRRGYTLDHTLCKHDRQDLLPIADAIKQQKDQVFRMTMTDRVQPIPGVIETLEALSTQFRLGVDSTSTTADIQQLLYHLAIDRFFRKVSSCDMAWDAARYGVNNKANRFRWLADQLGVAPQRCIAVGDAEKDVVAAKQSGMLAVAIPTEYTKDNDFTLADSILAGIDELTPSMALQLIEGANSKRHSSL